MTVEASVTEGLVMELAGRRVCFLDPVSFDFALQARSRVSLAAQAWLEGLPREDIDRERAAIRRLRQWLEAALPSRVASEQDIQAGALPGDTLAMLADEHQWAEVLGALSAGGPGRTPFMTIALVRFGDYLSEREWALARALRQAKQGSSSGARVAEARVELSTEDPLCATGDAVQSPPWDVATGMPGGPVTTVGPWVALPQGRAETLTLNADEALRLNCAGVVLSLNHSGRPPGNDSSQNGEIALRTGPNVLGRDPACDVVLRGASSRVSRMHVLVVDHGQGRLVLTDLSRNGTYLLDTRTR